MFKPHLGAGIASNDLSLIEMSLFGNFEAVWFFSCEE